LRDDLSCDPGGPKNGIGYTVLATSRDALKWHRYREPFLDRNLSPKTWDHAMAWASAAVPVGEEVFIYYGGYARGHKVERDKERQIGLARLRRDGYVSLSAGERTGSLITQPLIFEGNRLTLNADPGADGIVRVEILGAEDQPVEGFSLTDCDPVRSNGVLTSVRWQDRPDVSSVAGTPVRLRFEMRGTRLFAFQFHR
jgi:hypothetical protein